MMLLVALPIFFGGAKITHDWLSAIQVSIAVIITENNHRDSIIADLVSSRKENRIIVERFNIHMHTDHGLKLTDSSSP